MKGGFVVGCRKYKKLDEELKLKIKKEYLEGTSCTDLAKKNNVSLTRLRDLITDEKWLDQKHEVYRKSTEKYIEKISDELAKKRSDVAASIYSSASVLADKAKNIIDGSDNLSDLAKASKLLKSACELLGIKPPEEMKLQAAQTEKLEAETEFTKSRSKNTTQTDDGITFNINFPKS